MNERIMCRAHWESWFRQARVLRGECWAACTRGVGCLEPTPNALRRSRSALWLDDARDARRRRLRNQARWCLSEAADCRTNPARWRM